MKVGAAQSDRGDVSPRPKKLLGEILKEMELVSEAQIDEAVRIQSKESLRIGQVFLKLGYVAREEVLLALAYQRGVDPLDLRDADDLRGTVPD